MDETTIKAIAETVAGIIRKDLAPELQKKPLYTTTEAAAFLGVKRSYIYELIRGNKISYFRSRGGKLVYIRRTELLKWAEATPVPSLSETMQRETI